MWYHVLSGGKVFYVLPPTENNYAAFEAWSRSAHQSSTLLPEFVGGASTLERIELSAGDTLIIPGGWIHAVLTPRDSVVFGGNFLHGGSTAVNTMLRVARLEDALGVPAEARFPLYRPMLWYATMRYADALQVERAACAARDASLAARTAAAIDGSRATALACATDEAVEARANAPRALHGGGGLTADEERGLRILAAELRTMLSRSDLVSGEDVPPVVLSPPTLLLAIERLLHHSAEQSTAPPPPPSDEAGRRTRSQPAPSATPPPLPRGIPTGLGKPVASDPQRVVLFRRGTGEHAPLPLWIGPHNEICEACGDGGELVCCDHCNLVYHLDCVPRPETKRRGAKARVAIADGPWACPLCAGEAKTVASAVWPEEAEHSEPRFWLRDDDFKQPATRSKGALRRSAQSTKSSTDAVPQFCALLRRNFGVWLDLRKQQWGDARAARRAMRPSPPPVPAPPPKRPRTTPPPVLSRQPQVNTHHLCAELMRSPPALNTGLLAAMMSSLPDDTRALLTALNAAVHPPTAAPQLALPIVTAEAVAMPSVIPALQPAPVQPTFPGPTGLQLAPWGPSTSAPTSLGPQEGVSPT